MITIPSSGQFGLIEDALPQELPPNAWSSAQNVRFRNGSAQRFNGSTQVLTTPTVTPYWITPYRNLTNKFWVYAGIARVFGDNGSVRTDLTPASAFTGAVDDRWTGGSAQGVLVINNGIDQPQFWGGNTGTPFATLTGWNSAWRCASLRPFKNYLVALDVTKSGTRFGNMVKWSAAAVPGALPTTWDETDATKDAGEQDLAETTDYMVDTLPLGDINVIYKERSMYGMQYIGGTFVWRFWRLPGNYGMLARGCAVDTPKGHVVLTSGDLILHNGQGPQSIVEGRMRRWLFNSIDTTNFGRSFLCVNPTVNEVWVCFPESGQTACTKALVWNWNDDTFAIRQLQNATYGNVGPLVQDSTAAWSTDLTTWDSDTSSWGAEGFGSTENRLLVTQTNPVVVQMDTGVLFDAENPTCIAERTGLAFDKPDIIKTVKSITPRIEGSMGSTIQIEVGGAMDAEGSTTWSPAVTYTVGSTRKADCFATGRFLGVRFTSTSSSPWRIKSFDLDIVERGPY